MRKQVLRKFKKAKGNGVAEIHKSVTIKVKLNKKLWSSVYTKKNYSTWDERLLRKKK